MPDLIYSSDFNLRYINKNIISLYPQKGYYIDSNNKNEFFGDSKIIKDSNAILYLKHLKTEIPSGSTVTSANLKLYLSEVSDDAVVNVYRAEEWVDEDTNWSHVSSSGSFRGVSIGSLEINKNDNDQDYINIDITDFVNDYIYGASDYRGLIIEVVPNSINNINNFRVVGLYCKDENCCIKQNPIIEVEYEHVLSYEIDVVKSLKSISEDCYINKADKNANYGDAENIVVETEEGDGETKYGLFKFDLGDIPLGSDILSAFIYIPINNESNSIDKCGNHSEIVKRILQDWNEDYATWEKADINFAWDVNFYDKEDEYDSYNFIVEPEIYTYDVTRILQVAFKSFSLANSEDFYGFLIKGNNIVYDSKEKDDSGYIEVVYLTSSLNQKPAPPFLVSPESGAYSGNQPTFEAIINNDNKYGVIDGDDLDFRIEISLSEDFSNISYSYSTTSSTTGWHWSAIGDFSDDSTTFPIVAGTYTAGVSRVRFVMSESLDGLSENSWYWRMFTIDDI